MPTGIEAIRASIEEAILPGFRGSLLARGQSRSLIWREGQLPADAPNYSGLLSYDLQSYGYGLLGQGLRLIDGEGDSQIARAAFEKSAEALESVVQNGLAQPETDFHRIAAAAAYHLGRFSARAYSLLSTVGDAPNVSPLERCLRFLMLRDIESLTEVIDNWREDGTGDDENILALLREQLNEDDEYLADDVASDGGSFVDAINLALTDNYISAISTFLLALERGEHPLVEEACSTLEEGLAGCDEMGLVAQWWCHRLTIHLLRDLWYCSFHVQLPLNPPTAAAAEHWANYLHIIIASLYRRRHAEIELWPSQLVAAEDAVSGVGNLVVSLPTSAGKTRIAELCILACLATGKRVVFVTPLRALSAQTELSLSKTFSPLGKTVSSLYGSIGVSETDSNFLMDRDIIIATPEKLDFALRSDPDLLNDVGLVVLDEGHMIGIGEREIRYEMQIQRLLQRSDAASRRIVCLSAVFPEGEQLDDFVAWLSGDDPDALVKKDWRPTRLRYGEVFWKGDHARFDASIGDDASWIENYFPATIPPKRQKTAFPRDQRELCLATAWKVVDEGKTALIFCPLRKSVEPFARTIVDLHKRGALPSLFRGDIKLLKTALAVGAEWFGDDHPLLECLKLGVAVHHGALPSAYRREIEKLLRERILPVTISSPTLAQGLNLSASAVIFHSVFRIGEPIQPAQFRNIVGRAGRAYVDVEGLALYPIFSDLEGKHHQAWKALTADAKGQEMESGLLELLLSLLLRMAKKIGSTKANDLVSYVLNNASVWDFPRAKNESVRQVAAAEAAWVQHMTSLDTALLSTLGDREVSDDQIELKIDEVLANSLFSRRLRRRKPGQHPAYRQLLIGRAKAIWSVTTPAQRKGYFLAGVGLETGQQLDKYSQQLNNLLVEANGSILANNKKQAIVAITAFAEIAFAISPFGPDKLPANWKVILRDWLSGMPLTHLTEDEQDPVLHFVEQALVYRLPWAMEAVRVRGLSHLDAVGELNMDDFELGAAVASVETGTLNRSASILMRAGFGSRLAAIKVVQDLVATFDTTVDMKRWLRTREVREKSQDQNWPTPETHGLWVDFLRSFRGVKTSTWRGVDTSSDVSWTADPVPLGTPLRAVTKQGGSTILVGKDNRTVGRLKLALNPYRRGVLQVQSGKNGVNLSYIGPDDLEPDEF